MTRRVVDIAGAVRELHGNYTWRGVLVYLRARRVYWMREGEGPVWRVLLKEPNRVRAAAAHLSDGAFV